MAKEYISIIQGDTLDVVLTVHNPYELPIEEVKFICKSLELDKVMSPTLEQDEDGDDLFVLMLTPEETQPLWVGNWNFDVIVKLESGEIYTVVHEGQFEVIHRKENDQE